MTQRGNDVSNMCRFLPKLTMNGLFIRDFIAAEQAITSHLGVLGTFPGRDI